MTPGDARGTRDTSRNGKRWHTVTKRDNGHLSVTPGQSPVNAGQKGRPQQDSNLRSRLRRAVLYPLSYGGDNGMNDTSSVEPPAHSLRRDYAGGCDLNRTSRH